MKISAILVLSGFLLYHFHSIGPAQDEKKDPGEKSAGDNGKLQLIIRLDDAGFCHGANMALEKILNQGVCSSVSVIVNTPWLDEAVEILRSHPEVSVGVHLVLNSEWREFRWGPVMPYSEVPSLVDAFGKFFGSRRELMAHEPKPEEAEKELRAQIELALRKGLNISYCDYHMGAALNCLEFQQAVEKLALEYGIGISRYFGEQDTESVYSIPPEQKLEQGLKIIEGLKPERPLMVFHPGSNTPEMAVMTDLNSFGLKNMAGHRQAETDMLCHPKFREALRNKGIELMNYKQLKEEGLHKMKRPFTAKPWEEVVKEAQMAPNPNGTEGRK